LSTLGMLLFLAVVLLEWVFISWQMAVEAPPETM
jgi:hypothetical protein